MNSLITERIKDSAATKDQTLTPTFPRNILFELTNACNHACIFCYNRSMRRKRGQLNKQLYSRLIAEAYALGAREAGFATTGEAFASPDLFDCVAEAKSIGFEYTYLSTNGALLTEAKVEQLFACGLDSIKFSINAGNRESYRHIHGRDDFEHVVAIVRLIHKRRRELSKNIKLFSTTILTSETKNEGYELRKELGGCFDDMFFSIETGAIGPTNSCIYTLPCPLLFNRAHITCEGYLTICCVDFENNLVVANLWETTLAKAWHNLAFQEIRCRHLMGDVAGTLCDICISRQEKPYTPFKIP